MSRVERTCTEIPPAVDDQRQYPEYRPLKDYRDVPAYVLLGDPGAGKTTAFKTECEALGESAIDPIPASTFLTYDTNTIPQEWQKGTLFIDALDEVRAGTQDGNRNFRDVVKLLRALDKPRVRISCRDADWLDERDRELLSDVSTDGNLMVLRLDPLTDSQISQILSDREEISDPREFVRTAREHGVGALLENPLSLRMLADVVASGEELWPETRLELFQKATSLLAAEENDAHKAADPQPPVSELLDAAGRLCAVLLISGATGYTLRHRRASDGYLHPDQCEYDHDLLPRTLDTRLFTAESPRPLGPRTPSRRRVPRRETLRSDCP